MNKFCVAAVAAFILPAAAFAQDIEPVNDPAAFAAATQANACPFGVASAIFTGASEITVNCLPEGGPVTGNVPLVGGASAIIPGLAFVIAAVGAGSGDSTSDTQ